MSGSVNGVAKVESQPKLVVRNLTVFYGEKKAVGPVAMDIVGQHVTALIGPSGCGKSTFLRSLNRMNELIPSCRIEGERQAGRRSDLWPGDRPGGGPAAHRDGVPALESLPQVDRGERCLWPPHRRHQRLARHRRARRAGADAGGAVGRGEGPVARERLGALGRTAAAPLYRARAGGGAGGAADGRAGLGARSDRHRAHRRADQRAVRALHDRHRHAQHAAGGARRRLHGVLLPGRAGRVRSDGRSLHEAERLQDGRLHHRAVSDDQSHFARAHQPRVRTGAAPPARAAAAHGRQGRGDHQRQHPRAHRSRQRSGRADDRRGRARSTSWRSPSTSSACRCWRAGSRWRRTCAS